jgi:hypothetical protein
MSKNKYTYSAVSVLNLLPPNDQVAIELLRKTHLMTLVSQKIATIYSNSRIPIEYKVSIPQLNITLYFHEEFASGEAIIFMIDHPIKNVNGHAKSIKP